MESGTLTEAECLALLARGAARIAAWRARNAEHRHEIQRKEALAEFWRHVDAQRANPARGNVIKFEREG